MKPLIGIDRNFSAYVARAGVVEVPLALGDSEQDALRAAERAVREAFAPKQGSAPAEKKRGVSC